MLTELFLLSQALEDIGFRRKPQHRDIQIPSSGTGPVIRICLDASGSVVLCERVPKENESGLWTHINWNANSFPVIRLAQPLMELPSSQPTRPRRTERQSERKAFCVRTPKSLT